ncbi:hypothetical protein [Alteraurantiacibacter aquimixticola]|uniref:Uncharacterized protein n=1 Tax=Alteraurantiacibacter aquimixticola TaxID=2489173 RepID=A0A4T3F255_9SPHN|nr:hypothetical protein [Alteraurantiacibacter aquimixticola]TIX51178.1 hypothetical protein E5222_01515 [Alteraurantiacibacter aquimixticola]
MTELEEQTRPDSPTDASSWEAQHAAAIARIKQQVAYIDERLLLMRHLVEPGKQGAAGDVLGSVPR